MKRKEEVIAIIPARGGSKGLPRKNIIDLCGKPLIAYSILAALKAQLISRVIVSTDDEEIADISKRWGAEVPFLRPKELAEDSSGIKDAISYTVKKLGGYPSGRAYVQLYPTSPFRTPALIDDMTKILMQGYSSVTTVKEITIDPQHIYRVNNGNYIKLLEDEKTIPKWKKYYRTFPIFLGHYPQKPEKHYYHVLTDKCMFVDIDGSMDLALAKKIIHNQLFEFGF